jgi:hypothetical protein
MEQVGKVNESVIKTLGLSVVPGTPIFLGETNRSHMKASHPADYKKYGKRMSRIINEPDYVGLHIDGSIEYIKCWGKYIKVAVRVAGDGDYYARSLYHVEAKLAGELIASGRWKALTKTD